MLERERFSLFREIDEFEIIFDCLIKIVASVRKFIHEMPTIGWECSFVVKCKCLLSVLFFFADFDRCVSNARR